MIKYPLLLLTILFLFSCTFEEKPQEPDPLRRKSPIAIVKVNHRDTYVKIVYGQPYKRGRKIFGELESFGEVWRTGANEATELTTTKEILFAGHELEAGTYALFTIPGRKQWTVILNSQLGQWGAFEYNPDFDVLRVDVQPLHTDHVTEAFTIKFGEIVNNSTSIILKWDQIEVRIPVGFTSASTF